MEKRIKVIGLLGIVKSINTITTRWRWLPSPYKFTAISIEVHSDEVKDRLYSALRHAGYDIDEKSPGVWNIYLLNKIIVEIFFE